MLDKTISINAAMLHVRLRSTYLIDTRQVHRAGCQTNIGLISRNSLLLKRSSVRRT